MHCTVTVETVEVKSSACRPYISHHCSCAVIFLILTASPSDPRKPDNSALVFQVEVLGHLSLVGSCYGICLKKAAKMKNYIVSMLLYISRKNQIRTKRKKKERKNLSFSQKNKKEQGKKKWYKMDNSLARNPFSNNLCITDS